jgi:hypothetical protein
MKDNNYFNKHNYKILKMRINALPIKANWWMKIYIYIFLPALFVLDYPLRFVAIY